MNSGDMTVSPQPPLRQVERESISESISSDSDLSELEDEGKEFLSNPTSSDHTADVEKAKGKKALVNAFLSGEIGPEKLHERANPIIKYCKSHPLLLLGLGGVGVALGIGLFAGGLAISGASFGAASPIGGVMIALSMFAMAGGLTCCFGGIMGHAIRKAQSPEALSSTDKKVENLAEEIRDNKILSGKDKEALIGLVAGEKSQAVNKKLGIDYQAAMVLRRSPKGVDTLSEYIEENYSRGQGDGDLFERLTLLQDPELDYQQVYENAVEIASQRGSKEDQAIIARGKGRKWTSARIWTTLQREKDRLKAEADKKATTDEKVTNKVSIAYREVLEEANKVGRLVDEKVVQRAIDFVDRPLKKLKNI